MTPAAMIASVIALELMAFGFGVLVGLIVGK